MTAAERKGGRRDFDLCVYCCLGMGERLDLEQRQDEMKVGTVVQFMNEASLDEVRFGYRQRRGEKG